MTGWLAGWLTLKTWLKLCPVAKHLYSINMECIHIISYLTVTKKHRWVFSLYGTIELSQSQKPQCSKEQREKLQNGTYKHAPCECDIRLNSPMLPCPLLSVWLFVFDIAIQAFNNCMNKKRSTSPMVTRKIRQPNSRLLETVNKHKNKSKLSVFQSRV